jgi:hypothetical protein
VYLSARWQYYLLGLIGLSVAAVAGEILELVAVLYQEAGCGVEERPVTQEAPSACMMETEHGCSVDS